MWSNSSLYVADLYHSKIYPSERDKSSYKDKSSLNINLALHNICLYYRFGLCVIGSHRFNFPLAVITLFVDTVLFLLGKSQAIF